ncbi:UPF0568 protein C14orf166 homolog [Copidosoma floridanum]|uniref:UPF0568 protein C14orf166 homolog n=1 Tax=Copidosoma floridanum TaxID=29053 RepID=UPI0006C958EB|nr:UPF0568 protein C14orf166 homolog [Copidosoma floridanum]
MFKRKLKALGYMEWDKVNGNDEQHVKKLVNWLEDQNIRHYKIEDRTNLHNINSNQWQETYDKYLADLGCPSLLSPLEKLEWLVALAVRLEFEDDCEKYKAVLSSKKNEAAPTVKSTNPLDNLDFQCDDFKNGVNSLAKLLTIPQHPNHLMTLEACAKLICKRLNPAAIQYPNSVIVTGKPFPIMETEVGFNMGDKVLTNAAKVLCLLYIQDLRDLQTKINEAIVSVQSITANPKTDTKLGKVGR